MLDLSAFHEPLPTQLRDDPPKQGGSSPVARGQDAALLATAMPILVDIKYDADGLIVPRTWAWGHGWGKQPLAWRTRRSNEYLADEIVRAEKERKRADRRKTPSTRFSTDAAIEWGRRQGWKLVERESYDYRTKRHHDCQLGMDAIMSKPGGQLVGVQGAGRSERLHHYQRFDERGGIAVAKVRNMEIWYIEFLRGNPEPVVKERWA